MDNFIFDQYKNRVFQSHPTYHSQDWKIKISTISHKREFSNAPMLQKTIAHLNEWIPANEIMNFPIHKIGFLILHEGKHGYWAIFNYWMGGELLNSTTFHHSGEPQGQFRKPMGSTGMTCVWEQKVIIHEHMAWIKHILKKAEAPDIEGYLADRLEGEH